MKLDLKMKDLLQHNRYEWGRYLMYWSIATDTMPYRDTGGIGIEVGGSNGVLQRCFPHVEYWHKGAQPHNQITIDAHNLPYKDGIANVVVTDAVIEHLWNPFIVAEEIARITQPGGLLICTAPSSFMWHGALMPYDDYWRFTPDALRVLFKDAFEEMHVKSIGSLPFCMLMLKTHSISATPDSRLLSDEELDLVLDPRNIQEGHNPYAVHSWFMGRRK